MGSPSHQNQQLDHQAVDEDFPGLWWFRMMVRAGVSMFVVFAILVFVSLAVGRALDIYEGEIAFTANRHGELDIYLLDVRGGAVYNLTNHPGMDVDPVWSPDGMRLLFVSSRDGDLEIYTMNGDGSDLRQLTHNNTFDGSPVWSPDGRQIAFVSAQGGFRTIHVMDNDGGEMRRLINGPITAGFDEEPDWSPDGAKIAFVSSRGWAQAIHTIDLETGTLRRLTNSSQAESMPYWSPDGSRFAFTRVRSIILMDADGGNLSPVINISQGAIEYAWSPVDDTLALLKTVTFGRHEQRRGLYLIGADSRNLRHIDNDDIDALSLAWSADGERFAFMSQQDGNPELYVINVDGTDIRRLTHHPASDTNPTWRPWTP